MAEGDAALLRHLKVVRRSACRAILSLRRRLPFVVADAAFHLPSSATDDTPELTRRMGWTLALLGKRLVCRPDILSGSDEALVACLHVSACSPIPDSMDFSALIPRGRVLGRTCGAIAPGGIVLSDVNRDAPNAGGEHRALSNWIVAPPPRLLRGTSLLVGSIGHRNFYHWLFDMLPRIGLARDAGFQEPDHWIMPASPLAVGDELLARVGIDPKRCIRLGRLSHVECERLVVTSAPGRICEPTRRSVEFLRKSLRPTSPCAVRRRVYVGRRGRRRIINEAHLVERLGKLGFQPLFLEDLSLQQQIDALARAECIVAPHGAGLAHVVQAEPGGAVIEILNPRYANPSYFSLAGACGLRYGCIAATPATQSAGHAAHCDMVIDVDRVVELAASTLR